MHQDISPADLRRAIRSGDFTGNTSGYAPGYVQCNLTILPEEWAGGRLRIAGRYRVTTFG